MKQAYREDIDGLRAIAVLAVVFYHAGLKYFSGGYVGVDVFFVISGYLITGIIVREIQENKFTLSRFYERRIRRIFPAVFTLILFVMIASALLYDAADYSNISRSAIATTFFSSNVLFWKESGYFEDPSTLKPLLHTWSLAVEEQYYIFFPLLMLLIARFFKSRFNTIILVLLIGSFALNIYGTYQYTSAAFYFMPMRAWELFTGSMLVFTSPTTPIKTGIRNLISALGVGAILASIVLFSEETIFPGWAAALPVFGSALVLYCGSEGETFIKKILSSSPLVFIGKISYSLYLWHWTLLVMGKYYLIREPTTVDLIYWLVITFMISTLSWRFIETPFRVGKKWTRKRIFAFGAASMALTAVISGAVYLSSGFPQRFASPTQTESIDDPERIRWGQCITEHKKEPPTEVSLCTIGAKNGKPEFLLWGDSHSRAVAPAVNKSASASGVTGYYSSMPGCIPLLGIDRQDQFQGSCSTYNDMLINFLEDHREIKTVILAGRWSISADGRKFKNEEGATKRQIDVWEGRKGTNAELFDLGLNRTVEKLLEMDRQVVIISGIPEVGYNVPSSYAIASRTGRDVNVIIAPTLQEYLDRNRDANNTIFTIEKNLPVLVIDPAEAMCNEEICLVVVDGQSLYRDDDHLSTFGAYYISYLFDPLFEELGKK